MTGRNFKSPLVPPNTLSVVENHVSNLLERNWMEEILPHGDEKVNLLRLADILCLIPKLLQSLSQEFNSGGSARE